MSSSAAIAVQSPTSQNDASMMRDAGHRRNAMPKSYAAGGFTLIELMITLVIMAVVITVGVPSFNDFIAGQRVRATASDLMADMAFARAEAIKESRIVVMEPIGGADTWKGGWRICVDLDNGRDCDLPDELRKESTGITGRTQLCAVGAVNAGMLFRPDGRAFIRAGTAPVGAGDGIRISDDLGDATTANDRIRLVHLGVSGRASVEVQDGGTACP